MSTIDERLAELGITLPTVVPPVAVYIPAVVSGNLVYTSGQLPIKLTPPSTTLASNPASRASSQSGASSPGVATRKISNVGASVMRIAIALDDGARPRSFGTGCCPTG